MDPSTMRNVVFPGVFWSGSSPISPILRERPVSAIMRQRATNPRDSLGFFVSSSEGVETVRDDSRPSETSKWAILWAMVGDSFECIVDSFEIV